jgi:hypothetical protein
MYRTAEEGGLTKFHSVTRKNEKINLFFLGKNSSFLILGYISQKQDAVNDSKSIGVIERK